RCPDEPAAKKARRRRFSRRRHQDGSQRRLYSRSSGGSCVMTLPRKRWWRVFFWIAVMAILVEVAALTSTFVEAHRRRVGDAPGLAPGQVAAGAEVFAPPQEAEL